MVFLFKSKIERIALFVLILSTVSLVIHLSITKFSAGDVFRNAAPIVDHFPLPDHHGGIPQIDVCVGKKRLWGPVKELDSLQPYANPRSTYKFKSFSYLYDEEQFIASLKNVLIVKSLPAQPMPCVDQYNKPCG